MPGRVLLGLSIWLLSASVFGQPAQSDERENADSTEEAAAGEAPPAIEPDDEETAKLGKVTVTGSHIRRAQIEGPQPVQVVTPEMVEQVGGVKLGDYLSYLPINQLSTDNRGNLMNPFSPAGASFFNLRGLGWETTLTLINGRRGASYGAAGVGSFVNINAFPLAAIERVEILKDGASAIYGSDAIAGVVNIILKDDYEGLDVSASYLDTEDGGAAERSVEVIGGRNFGRTNVTAVLSWYNQDALFARDRYETRSADMRYRGGYDNRSVYSTPPNALLFDDYQQGLFNVVPDPACPEESLSYVGWADADLCQYDYNTTAQFIPENERWAAQASLVHELTPSLQVKATVAYNHDEARREYAPSPVFWFPFVPVDHPDNPFGQNILLASRLTQTGNRKPRTETDGRFADLELRGFLGEWQWTGYLSWSDSKSDYRGYAVVPQERVDAALMGMGGENADMWFNPFATGSPNDPELLAWLQGKEAADFRTRERTAGAFADGAVIDLPWGPLTAAAGVEYRDQGEWNDFIENIEWGTDAVWHRQVRSAFLELNIPLFADLEVQLAQRYEDYSDFGSHTSPKIAVSWRPSNAFLVRASYAESFRAPYFYQLDAPAFQDEVLDVEDPLRCPATDDARDCRGLFVTENSGNPDLGPETGKSWFAGIVWSPDAVRGLDLELDYWKFTYDDRIYDVDAGFIVDSFADNPDWVVRADPTPEDQALGIPGRIELIYVRPLNINKTETRGVDLAARYRWSTENLGRFNAELVGTYLDLFKESDQTTGDYEFNDVNVAGTAFFVGTGQPRWRLTSSLAWSRGNHGASAVVRFFDSYQDHTNWPDEDGDESDREHEVPSWTTFDVQYSYVFQALGDAHLSLGCSNCGDRSAPLFFNSGADLGVHSILGRTWYARWSQPFGRGGG